MEAKEIRLGNIISSDKSKLPYWDVTIDDMIYIFNNPNYYNGVPLTEEWLLRFGFQLHDGDQSFENGEIAVKQTHKDRFIVGYKYTDAGWQYLKHCGFNEVHKLQNLYYALTGEELTLNK